MQDLQENDTIESIGIWLTNRTTGQAYRTDDTDLIPKSQWYKLPARFHRESKWDWISRNTAADIQLNTPGSKAARLVRHYGTRGLYLYTLSAWELGVADPERIVWLEAPENYDNPATIEAWQRLINAAFPSMPFKSCLHCGRNNRTAPHVIAGVENAIPRPTYERYEERRKQVQDTFEDRRRVFAYLCSKQYPTHEQVQAFRRAVAAAGGILNLPQHSGFSNMGFVRIEGNDVLHDNLEKDPQVIGFDENILQPTLLEHFGRWLKAESNTVPPPSFTTTCPTSNR